MIPNHDPSDLNENELPDFDSMTPAQFEHYLPEFFASRSSSLIADPRLQKFLDRNPDCAALVRDLEAIAKAASDLLPIEEPSDSVWSKIQKEMGGFGAPSSLIPETE